MERLLRMTVVTASVAVLAVLGVGPGCRQGDGPTEDLGGPPATSPLNVTAPAEEEAVAPGAAVEELSSIRLSGEVFLRERIALPRDASLLVRLVELSSGGEVGAELARVEVSSVRHQPIHFELVVAGSEVKDNADYGLTASISRRGVIAFSVDAPVRVLAPGSQATGLRLLLRRSG